MTISDLTFWQNVGAAAVGFLLWMVILVFVHWVTTLGSALLSKWTTLNIALGWLLLLAMSLGVTWIFWATGIRLLHGV